MHSISWRIGDQGIELSDIDFVVSDANGTIVGDKVRAKSIADTIGSETPVTSYRGVFGESYGVAGMFDVVAAIADMEENRVSPTFGATEAPEGINLVTGSAIALESTYALITSVTVDGNCTAVVLKKR